MYSGINGEITIIMASYFYYGQIISVEYVVK